MWQLLNKTPFPAEAFFFRDLTGAEQWAVVLKATYRFDEGGTLTPASEQEALHKQLRHYGEPGRSSLKYDQELLPGRPHTDVVVLGHAVAPQGKAVASLEVGITLGTLQKRVQVFGDRVWKREQLKLVPSSPRPFTRMPLVWERAYGGESTLKGETTTPRSSSARSVELKNPVGIGAYSKEAEAEGKPLPNVEDPGNLIRNWMITPPPIGLGPIDPTWPSRLNLAGTFDTQWQKERMPLLPKDFDPRHYQSAPPDQQLKEYLRGGEVLELLNLTPEGRVRLTLPRLPLRFVTHFGKAHEEGEARHHDAVIQLVRVEPDERKLVLLFYTQLDCHHTLYKLKGTQVWLEEPLPEGPGPRPLNVPTEPRPGTPVARRSGWGGI